MPNCERGFRSWWLWVVEPRGQWAPPVYVRLWNGAVQMWRYGYVMSGVSTPGHGEHHRWWIRLEAPLSGGLCWWCGLSCYPSPLLPYSGRPRWLFNRLRRWTGIYMTGIRKAPRW